VNRISSRPQQGNKGGQGTNEKGNVASDHGIGHLHCARPRRNARSCLETMILIRHTLLPLSLLLIATEVQLSLSAFLPAASRDSNVRAIANKNSNDDAGAKEAPSPALFAGSSGNGNKNFLSGLLGPPLAKSSTNRLKLPENFELPEPRPLTVSSKTDLTEFAISTAASAIRLATGAFVLGWKIDTILAPEDDGQYALRLGPFRIRDSSSVLERAPRPDKPLILYEYEGSPYCKRVREIINLLDLTVEYRPCPGARQGFSDELFHKTGRRTVPYLIDPNTGSEMFESGDQIEYLIQTYGPPEDQFDRKALWPIAFEPFSMFTSTLVAVIRGMPGSRRRDGARTDNVRMQPLELWGYESSPFVMPVRQTLCELCLPHRMVSCSRGSKNRQAMIDIEGRFQVPYLYDPNTGVRMYESANIVEYLEYVYTAPK